MRADPPQRAVAAGAGVIPDPFPAATINELGRGAAQGRDAADCAPDGVSSLNSPPGAQPLPAGFSAHIRVAFHTHCAFLTPRRCPRCGDEFMPMPEDRICLRCDKRSQRSSKAMATRMARRWRKQYRREMGWI